MDFNINHSEMLIDRMLDYYSVSTYSELALKINTTQQTISSWKIRNSVNAIKKKCRELGIYDKIFNTLKYEPEPFSYPIEYFNEDTEKENPYASRQEELSKRYEQSFISEVLKMDKTIVSTFLNVYQKLEKEGNLIKLYEALGKLKYDKN